MTRFEPDSDPIPSAVRELQSLFEQDQLPSGGFPDVSVDSLAERMGAVQSHHDQVAQALEQLTDAQATLAAGQAALLDHARRGLRYAEVFAEGNDDLLQRLQALGFPSGGKPERRVRKRRAKSLTSSASNAPGLDTTEPSPGDEPAGTSQPAAAE